MARLNAMETFAKNVKSELARQKLSMRELSRRLEMDSGNLSRILSCEEGVTLDRASRIAEALQVELWTLLRNSEKMSLASA